MKQKKTEKAHERAKGTPAGETARDETPEAEAEAARARTPEEVFESLLTSWTLINGPLDSQLDKTKAAAEQWRAQYREAVAAAGG
jgi:hypothetical protein